VSTQAGVDSWWPIQPSSSVHWHLLLQQLWRAPRFPDWQEKQVWCFLCQSVLIGVGHSACAYEALWGQTQQTPSSLHSIELHSHELQWGWDNVGEQWITHPLASYSGGESECRNFTCAICKTHGSLPGWWLEHQGQSMKRSGPHVLINLCFHWQLDCRSI
jgi:hypothetical protein